MMKCVVCDRRDRLKFRLAGKKYRYVCDCGNKGPKATSPAMARAAWNRANTPAVADTVLNAPVERFPWRYLVLGVLTLAALVAVVI